MNEILFVVEEADDGSYRASAVGAAIHTEADSLQELNKEIRDTVHCHFEDGRTPLIRIHNNVASQCNFSLEEVVQTIEG